jgi:hypothetical protein
MADSTEAGRKDLRIAQHLVEYVCPTTDDDSGAFFTERGRVRAQHRVELLRLPRRTRIHAVEWVTIYVVSLV